MTFILSHIILLWTSIVSMSLAKLKVDEAHIDMFAKYLPSTPSGLGEPCSNRKFWDSISTQMSPSIWSAAKRYNHSKMKPWSNSDYLDYSVSGSRSKGESMIYARQGRLASLTLAECVSWSNEYMETLEKDIVSIAGQPSWSLPAHDGNLTYFYGTSYFMDLNSAFIVGTLGQILYMLGDKLSETTRSFVISQMDRRAFSIVKAMICGEKRDEWWMNASSNWNAVVWGDFLIGALSSVQSVHDRALFAAATYDSAPRYLDVFYKDGFDSEGVNYFNYGFSAFLLKRQALFEGTQGNVDLFEDPFVAKCALFSVEFPMSMKGSDDASFGDSVFGTTFYPSITNYIVKVFKLDDGLLDEMPVKIVYSLQFTILGLQLAAGRISPVSDSLSNRIQTNGPLSLRKYYDKAGVLVVRPSWNGSSQGLAGTFKLLGNTGSHSHDDIGSFVISLDGVRLVGDVGGPLYYTSETFGPERYLSPLINSYGHPVPVINGKLQVHAYELVKSRTLAKPFVISSMFSDDVDEISFDMTQAYEDEKLIKLTRKFMYRRTLAQSILMEDYVEYSAESWFETALTTFYNCKIISPNTVIFWQDDNPNKNRLKAEIESNSNFVLVEQSNIQEYGVTMQRIAIKITDKIKCGKVSVIFSIL